MNNSLKFVKLLLGFLFLTLTANSLPTGNHDKRSPEISGPQVVRVPLSLVTNPREQLECLPSQMTLYKFSKRRRAKCNDHSPAGYYLRRRPESKQWVIYLPGGWYCADATSCENRGFQDPQLVSSYTWDQCKERSGIMSDSKDYNPYLFDANMVYVPYCSSDMWTGRAPRHNFGNASYAFMGSVILEDVFRHLITHRGMKDASGIILAGSSAGGTGVFMNIDRIQSLITDLGVKVRIRGIADSAWYLLRPEMEQQVQCKGVNCPQVANLGKGVTVWQANIPARCHQSYTTVTSSHAQATPLDESWKCFFGYVIYPYVTAPVFVAQWMFDSFQIQADDADFLGRSRESRFYLGYIRNLSIKIRTQLEQVDGVFSPSCIDHAVLERREWTSILVSDINLSSAFNCWEKSLQEAESHNKTSSNDIMSFNEQAQSETGSFEVIEQAASNSTWTSYWYHDDYIETEGSTTCIYRAIDTSCIPQWNRSCQRLFLHSNEDIFDFLGVDIDSLVGRNGFESRSEFYKAYCGG
uniref:Palmitoleoyl-protein carboxylesterase NOTUM n=1 Tax=Phallusia mammillata TaxID=59560 RepID=A0A6F9DND1_9ASCI|nr:palmitoleoyl-protein carboxylesterase NOTUM precursor [Phallusia mammillata]